MWRVCGSWVAPASEILVTPAAMEAVPSFKQWQDVIPCFQILDACINTVMMLITETLRKEFRFQLGNQRDVASTKQDVLPVLTRQHAERGCVSHVEYTGQINAAELWSPSDVCQLEQAQPSAFVTSICLLAVAEGVCKEGSFHAAAQQLMLLGLAQYLWAIPEAQMLCADRSKVRHGEITQPLLLLPRSSHIWGAELGSDPSRAPLSSYLLRASGPCLESARKSMLHLHIWKTTSKPTSTVTAHHPKPAQPVTRLWLHAGSRSW